MRVHLVCGIVASLAGLGAFSASAIDLTPGEWVITSTGAAEGRETPGDKYRACLSVSAPVPIAQADREVCSVGSVKVEGNVVTWEVACNDPREGIKGEGRGRITYAGTKLTGSMEMSMKLPDEPPISMSVTLKGERVGDCPTH